MRGMPRAIDGTYIKIMGQNFCNENYINKKCDFRKLHFSFKLQFAVISFDENRERSIFFSLEETKGKI